MSRESTAIRRGCCAAESGRPGSAEKSPAVDCVEAETERSRKEHSKAKHCTELNLLKHNRAERHRAIHTKATTAAAVMVLSALLAADEGRRDVSVLVSALWASRMKALLCVVRWAWSGSLCWFHNKAYATSKKRTASAQAAASASVPARGWKNTLGWFYKT